MRTRHLFCTVFAALAALAAASSAAGPAQAASIGLNSDLTWGVSRTTMDRTVSEAASLGAGWVHQSISWADGEFDGKGQYNSWWFPEWDAAVDKARARGLNVALTIDGAPCWASADPARRCTGTWTDWSWNRSWKPANVADYADFVRYVVNRYKAKGVHTFEIWNEPNYAQFWPSGPNAAEYVVLLKAGYAAVKAADPGATVLMGGLSSNDWRYLEQIYTAGGGGYFDALNVHPYTMAADPDSCWDEPGSPGRKAIGALCGIEEIRAVADARGDTGKPVWITEMGYSTGSCSWCVTESQQSDYLVRALRRVDQRYPWVPVQMIYALRDDAWLGPAPGTWVANLGLMRVDFSAKPARNAVANYIAQKSVPVTTHLGPAVNLTSPTAGGSFRKKLSFAATASDDTAVSKVQFLLDGKLIATDTSAPYSSTWRVSSSTAYGAHTVTATSFDAAGLTASQSVGVTRTR